MSETKSSEFVDRAVDYLKKDIEINKKLSGIDFTGFLSCVLIIVNNIVFRISMDPSRRGVDPGSRIADSQSVSSTLMSIGFRVMEVGQTLSEESGKKVLFLNTPKAITAIGRIKFSDCSEELERLENIAQEMYCVDEDEIIQRGTTLLLRPL